MLCNYAPPPGSIPGYLQYGGRGRGSSANHPLPPPCDSIPPHNTHNTAARIPPCLHTTIHNRTTTLMYIKLLMYLLFIWRLYLMVLSRAASLLGALEGVGPENLYFFGPKWH
jgi:hypothetical protein